jgi:predicted N-acetyltransferase YhbS
MKVFLNNIQELKRVCEKGEDTLGHVRLWSLTRGKCYDQSFDQFFTLLYKS